MYKRTLGTLCVLAACLPALAWDITLPVVSRTDLGTLLESTAITADLDGDGVDEIIAAGRQEMIAVDGAGQERWRWRTKGRYMTTPAVLHAPDGRTLVYAADNAGLFTCLDGAGKVVWQAQLKQGSEWCAPVVAALEAGGAPVAVQCDGSGAVWAFNALDGAVLWQSQVKGAPVTPAVADLNGDGRNEIVVSTVEGTLAALNADGSPLWTQETTARTPAFAACAPVVFQAADKKARIVAAHFDDRVACLDGAGTLLWTQPARGGVDSSISAGDFDGDGKPEIFFATQIGVIYRYAEDGRLLWETDMQGRSLAPGAIIDVDNDGGMEYVLCTQNGRLMILGQDGALRFEMQFTHRTIGVTPAFGRLTKESNTLQMAITGGESGVLTLLDTPAKRGTAAEWFAYRRDSGNTGSWTPGQEKKRQKLKAAKCMPKELAASAAVQMKPKNLEDGKLLNGHPIEFTIRPEKPTAETWRAEAVCVTPDGARHAAIGRVLGAHGELQLPVDLTQAGRYQFTWSLTTEDNAVLASGAKEIRVRPFENELALLREAIAQLERAADWVHVQLPQTAKALNDERASLDASELNLKAKLKRKCATSEMLDAVVPLSAECLRDLQIAEVFAKSRLVPPGASLIPFLGKPWESRGVDAQLPEPFDYPLELAPRIVPGEHDATSLMLFNITNVELAVRVQAKADDELHVTLLHSQPVPTSQGDISWDPLPPLEGASILNIPPLQSREVWIDVDAAKATPGAHAVTVTAQALNGAAMQVAPASPLTVAPAETTVAINYNVLPFTMAPASAMRLCAWANAKDGDYADLLAHGNNIFITPLPPVTRDAKGGVTSLDTTAMDHVLQQLAGHDVMLLLQGLPALQGDVGSAGYITELTGYLAALTRHLAEKGIDLAHFALYPYDEPGVNGWGVVNNFVAFGKAVRAANPAVQIYQDGSFELPMAKVMEPVTDIWTPSIFDLPKQSEVMDLVRGSGKALWSYNCGYLYSRPTGPNLKNINIVAEYRNAALYALNYGASAIGYWSYNIGSDLWTRSWEEYALVYPGDGQPITSRRWEAVREGLEDARILIALKELASNTTNTSFQECVRRLCEEPLAALLNQSNEEMRLGLARYVLDATNNDEAVYRQRERLMNCVELSTKAH